MIRVRQPEQATNSNLTLNDSVTGNNDWSIGSVYDANGNVLTTTDAKNVVTSYSYDALNRQLTRSYNDGTPTVTNQYDNAPNGKGQLIEVTNSVSTSKFTQFDILGKPLVSQQITEGQTYTSSYQYNLSGALVSETYPSGRVVKNDYDTNGEISKIYGQKNAAATEQDLCQCDQLYGFGGDRETETRQRALGIGEVEFAAASHGISHRQFGRRRQFVEIEL